MIEFMKSIAKQAGAIALAGQLELQKKRIHTKGNARDLVTDTDRAVEEFICSRIREEYPQYGIFGEETGKSDSSSEYCFIIDPIDGTASFVHNLPNWCVSIGLHKNGEPVAAVVYQPVMDRESDNAIRVLTSGVELREIYVSDMSGRTMRYNVNGYSASIKLPVPNGVYLVQVIGDKLTRTEKVILK